MSPYINARKVYGPYIGQDGRSRVIVYWNNDNRQWLSYPRYLMEVHLGRRLEKDETIDHINRDFTDNRIENLQILDPSTHTSIDNPRVPLHTFTCPWCGKISSRKIGRVKWNRDAGKAGPFCSKRCSSSFSASIQHKRSSSVFYLYSDMTYEFDHYYLKK